MFAPLDQSLSMDTHEQSATAGTDMGQTHHREQVRLTTLLNLCLAVLNAAMVVGTGGLAIWLWNDGRIAVGTVAGTGGARQVTYGGKPLYYFFLDTGPGQVKGNITDKWGKWSVVVTVKPAHASSGSGSGGTNAGSGGVSF